MSEPLFSCAPSSTTFFSNSPSVMNSVAVDWLLNKVLPRSQVRRSPDCVGSALSAKTLCGRCDDRDPSDDRDPTMGQSAAATIRNPAAAAVQVMYRLVAGVTGGGAIV